MVEKVPAEGVGLSALRRSSKVCAGYTPPVDKGDGRSPVFVAPEDFTNTSNSVFASCFSALLMDEDDEGTEARDKDPAPVPTVKEEMSHSRLSREARIGSLEWGELRSKLPSSLHNASPGHGNSAAEAVWNVLDEIGTGCPGWNGCSAASARGGFTQSSGEVQWSEARRNREAMTAMEAIRRSIQAKADCLREHAAVGGHKLCGGDDFYTALDKHNVVIERESRDAVAMLGRKLLPFSL